MANKIMFVCTGNVCRSMLAEHFLRKYLSENNIYNINISSCGIQGGMYQIFPEMHEVASIKGLNTKLHIPRKADKKILDSEDVIISMALNHKEALKEEFNIDSILFNEACYNEISSVFDVPDILPDWYNKRDEIKGAIAKIADYIEKSTPKLYEYIKNHSAKVK